jgi:hypothetical protein
MTPSIIYLGYDPRPAEVQAFAVARSSIVRRLSSILPVRGLLQRDLREAGLYDRQHEVREDGRTYDVISDAPMATEFSITRFLVPHLAQRGWAIFADADVMARANILRMFDEADPSKACMVVKHDYRPTSGIKMDGQVQTGYERKNWSSVVMWNCEHPGTKALTLHDVNTRRGLWLHQFSWLEDKDIGELHPKWNWLVGHSDPEIVPALVHFTEGVPSMPGYSNVPYAREWYEELEFWAR